MLTSRGQISQSMSVIHQPRKPDLDARVLLFPAILFLLLAMLFLRLWYFQVVQSDNLSQKATEINTTKVPALAPRGLIYDRNGVLLAGVKPEWVIMGTPRLVDKNPGVLKRVAALLGADPKKLEAKLALARYKPWVPAPIHIGATTQIACLIAERSDEFPGIDVRSQPMRYYADNKSFSHLMGYVWIPSAEDVKRIEALGRTPADYVGKDGVEATYEKQLMGVPGTTRMEVDAKRRPTKVVGRDSAVPGNQLILGIDKNLQQVAMEGLKGKRGAVVAVDPNTGEVLCMASSPSYDLRLFKNGISHSEFDAIMHDPGNPFLNRPIAVKFAPGSTFKIVTTIAAMQAGYFDPNRPEVCNGGISLGNRFIKCLGHHGSVTFRRAMAKSCNAYFMRLALNSKREGILKSAQAVGIYQKTGVDLPYERRGDLGTEAYMEQYYGGYKWPAADTAYLGIGQGVLAVTPMQMANLMALVANDGVNYKPHLVRAQRNALDPSKIEKVPSEELHRIKASAEFWLTLKSALVDVIEAGTAGSARIPGIRWGGKTGSAEEKKGNLTHSWFVGFAPYDNPKIAICVFVERGGHGGSVAAPIAKLVVERYLVPPKVAAASSMTRTLPAASVDLSVSPISR